MFKDKLLYPFKKISSSLLKKELLHFPNKIQIETTTACNSNCIMCPHSSMKRSMGHMEFSLFKKIIDECSWQQEHITHLYPFLNGELFMTPKWEEYLSYARRKLPKASISIYTNGSLLNETNTAKLLEIGPDFINISFDGTDKQTYEGIRRNLCFEEVENNIRSFISKRDSLGLEKPVVSLSIIEMKQTAAGIPGFLERWKHIADNVTVEPFNTWAGDMNDMSGTDKNARPRAACSRLWYNFTILNSGKVALCCLDYDGKTLLGDVNTETISEIWSNEAFRNIRKLHDRGEFDKLALCKNCNYGKYQTEAPFWWI